MFSFLYNVALLLLGGIALPKILWQWIVVGKYRRSISQRLGRSLPKIPSEQQVMWIHAVSLGEMRAALPFIHLLKEEFPQAAIVISSTTETGLAEAERSMPQAAAHFFLPLDFSWIMRRVMRQLHPHILVLCESDFWYHLISYARAQGTSVLLINGKISETSARRFGMFPSFSRKIFSHFDHLCVQNHRFYKRFVDIGIQQDRLSITGNLKFDCSPKLFTSAEQKKWKEELGIQEADRVVVIGSSHSPEEEWILTELDAVWKVLPSLKVLLVPRHPERFKEVAAQVKKRGLSSCNYSNRQVKTGQEKVILIDTMGILTHCYQIAEIAIVAGSFVPSVGGHNLFESIAVGVPVLFGPHMDHQLDLREAALHTGAGQQVTREQLAKVLIDLLQDREKLLQARQGCCRLTQQLRGAVSRTFLALRSHLA